MRKAKKDQPGYDLWKANHISNINHTKLSGEAASAVDIFNKSIDKNNLICHEYIGHSDPSSFKEAVDAYQYEKYIIPSKLEFIDVQNRLGTRLLNCLKSHKGTSKFISGKGKMTDKVVNSMQDYYGLAIRNNVLSGYNMTKATSAVLCNCTYF